jgi:hypothetical protein
MEIGVDKGVIREKGKIFIAVGGSKDSKEAGRISGLRHGQEIYQSPQPILETISTYTHETGHIVGEWLPFRSGINAGEIKYVRTFDDIKLGNISINLTTEEIRYLRNYLLSKEDVGLTDTTLRIANKLLYKFFIGHFDPSNIKIHNVSQKKLEEIVAKTGSSTTVAKKGWGSVGIEIINTRQGRNAELPSIMTQAACGLILENTLRKYGIDFDPKDTSLQVRISPPHQRAQNIVARAFKGKNYRIPSKRDLNQS